MVELTMLQLLVLDDDGPGPEGEAELRDIFGDD